MRRISPSCFPSCPDPNARRGFPPSKMCHDSQMCSRSTFVCDSNLWKRRDPWCREITLPVTVFHRSLWEHVAYSGIFVLHWDHDMDSVRTPSPSFYTDHSPQMWIERHKCVNIRTHIQANCTFVYQRDISCKLQTEASKDALI